MEELNILVGAAEGTSYPEHIITLKDTFKKAIGNIDFVKDIKKVEKAIAALTIIDPETRVRAQLETNAFKTLRARAAKLAEETGEYLAPTRAQVDAYIEQGVQVWRSKQ